MSIILRPINLKTDLPGLAALRSEEAGEPVTVESLSEQEVKRPTDEITIRHVAVDSDGQIVGVGEAFHRANHRPGAFWVMVHVALTCRRQGVGTALYNEVEAFARQQNASLLRIKLEENKTDGLRFANHLGFCIVQHEFRSMLDIAAFDASRFADVIEAVQAQGIRFFTFAETDGGADAQRKLYDLNITTAGDNPSNDQSDVWPYEDFVRDVFGAGWFRPDGQIFAADGDAWIGMAAVGEVSPGKMHNMMTGVLREYRGRHIAFALKLLAIEFCRRRNAHSLETGNDSTNAPMLAINRKLGYRPEPGKYRLEKSLL